MFRFDNFGLTERGDVFGAFVCGVGFGVRQANSFPLLSLRGFLLGKLDFLSDGGFFRFPLFRFRRLFCFFKFGAADKGVCFSAFLCFFMFCFHELRSQSDGLILAELGSIVNRFSFVSFAFYQRARFRVRLGTIDGGRSFGFRANVGKNPPRETARESPRHRATNRSCSGKRGA